MSCVVCGSPRNDRAYYGEIRGMAESGEIIECQDCGVQTLKDFELADYADGYRDEVGADDLKRHTPAIVDIARYESAIDEKDVLDIGASNGAYMMGIEKYAKSVSGVEPNEYQRDQLSVRYKMYESLEECIKQGCEYDTITAWHVLEHVQDPVDFLEKCACLLKENGKIYLSTPNTDEILMKVLPDDFPKFFYRAWHPYYFTIDSMIELAKHAGLEVLSCAAKHSWGLGNTMSWLRDKKPSGQGLEIEPNQDALIDPVWRAYLEQSELGDTIYCVLSKDRRFN